MNLANFNISLSQSELILKSIGILKMKGDYGDLILNEFKKASQGDSYNEVYRVGIKNYDFNFLLIDDSYFQFSYSDRKGSNLPDIRYSFFQNPLDFKTYEDYLELLRGQGLLGDESNEEIGDMLKDEYEQYLNEQQINLSSLTFRFDIDLNNYRPLIHLFHMSILVIKTMLEYPVIK